MCVNHAARTAGCGYRCGHTPEFLNRNLGFQFLAIHNSRKFWDVTVQHWKFKFPDVTAGAAGENFGMLRYLKFKIPGVMVRAAGEKFGVSRHLKLKFPPYFLFAGFCNVKHANTSQTELRSTDRPQTNRNRISVSGIYCSFLRKFGGR